MLVSMPFFVSVFHHFLSFTLLKLSSFYLSFGGDVDHPLNQNLHFWIYIKLLSCSSMVMGLMMAMSVFFFFSPFWAYILKALGMVNVAHRQEGFLGGKSKDKFNKN